MLAWFVSWAFMKIKPGDNSVREGKIWNDKPLSIIYTKKSPIMPKGYCSHDLKWRIFDNLISETVSRMISIPSTKSTGQSYSTLWAILLKVRGLFSHRFKNDETWRWILMIAVREKRGEKSLTMLPKGNRNMYWFRYGTNYDLCTNIMNFDT